MFKDCSIPATLPPSNPLPKWALDCSLINLWYNRSKLLNLAPAEVVVSWAYDLRALKAKSIATMG